MIHHKIIFNITVMKEILLKFFQHDNFFQWLLDLYRFNGIGKRVLKFLYNFVHCH